MTQKTFQSPPLTFQLHSSKKPAGDQPKAIEELLLRLKENKKHSCLLGVTGSGKTYTCAQVIAHYQKPTLVLAHNKTLAAQLYGELKSFFPQNAVEYFVSYYDYYRPEAYVASSDTYIEKDAAINDEIDKLRHQCTAALLERPDCIVVASVSCIYGIGSPEEYRDGAIHFYQGMLIAREEVLRKLIHIQYSRNDIEFFRGHFRVVGDNVDIFPPYEDSKVIRLVFFDEEIERIEFLDPLLGTTLKLFSKITIYPKSHYVVSQDKLNIAMENIRIELRNRLSELEREQKLVERQRLEQRTLLDLEMMEELGYCQGVENYSRHLTGSPEGSPPPTLIDFFPQDFLLIVDESHMTLPQVRGMYRGDYSRKKNLVDFGFRLPSCLDNRPLKFEEFENKIASAIYVSATPGQWELEKCQGEIVTQIIRPTGLLDPEVEILPREGQVHKAMLLAKEVIQRGQRVLMTTLTKRLAQELSDFLSSSGLLVKYLHSDIETLERLEILRDLRLGHFHILVGINLLREGLDLPEVGLVCILDAHIQGFLRSTSALIQTIGRAARNTDGKVVMFGSPPSPAMLEAQKLSHERRLLQAAYNQENQITPQTVYSQVGSGVLEILKRTKKHNEKELSQDNNKQQIKSRFVLKDKEEVLKRIGELQKDMLRFSRSLEFEAAARCRDEMLGLKKILLDMEF
jgi:excinuclease ABC subunit B